MPDTCGDGWGYNVIEAIYLICYDCNDPLLPQAWCESESVLDEPPPKKIVTEISMEPSTDQV